MSDELKTIKFQLMLSPKEAEAIDEWGFSHRIRTRAEAMRRLCQIGLLTERRIKDVKTTDQIFLAACANLFAAYTEGLASSEENNAEFLEKISPIKDEYSRSSRDKLITFLLYEYAVEAITRNNKFDDALTELNLFDSEIDNIKMIKSLNIIVDKIDKNIQNYSKEEQEVIQSIKYNLKQSQEKIDLTLNLTSESNKEGKA